MKERMYQFLGKQVLRCQLLSVFVVRMCCFKEILILSETYLPSWRILTLKVACVNSWNEILLLFCIFFMLFMKRKKAKEHQVQAWIAYAVVLCV